MSERNGDKSRFQINRKRTVLRRVRIRELTAQAKGGSKTTAAAGAKEGKSK